MWAALPSENARKRSLPCYPRMLVNSTLDDPPGPLSSEDSEFLARINAVNDRLQKLETTARVLTTARNDALIERANALQNVLICRTWLRTRQAISQTDPVKATRSHEKSLFTVKGLVPPQNAEGIEKALLGTHLPKWVRRYERAFSWDPATDQRLALCVKKQLAQEIATTQAAPNRKRLLDLEDPAAKRRRTDEGAVLATKDECAMSLPKAFMDSVGEMQSALMKWSTESLLAEITYVAEGHTWDSGNFWKRFWDDVALSMGGMYHLTGMDVQLRWCHHLDPGVNQERWTKDEDLLLIGLVAEFKGRRWRDIAAAVGTRRTPFQVYQRYVCFLNRSTPLEWTAEEDRQLEEAVRQFGAKWRFVGAAMPGRDNYQCRTRWVGLRQKSGFWTPVETFKLAAAVEFYQCRGTKSYTISQIHVPGKIEAQCRERVENFLVEGLNRTFTFSEKEKQLLLAAVQELGVGQWSAIAERVPGRTDYMCMKVYSNIDPYGTLCYDFVRAVRHRMLPKLGQAKKIPKRHRQDANPTALDGTDFQVRAVDQCCAILQEGMRGPHSEASAPNTAEERAARLRLVAKLAWFLRGVTSADESTDRILEKLKGRILSLKERELGLRKGAHRGVDLSSQELATVPDAEKLCPMLTAAFFRELQAECHLRVNGLPIVKCEDMERAFEPAADPAYSHQLDALEAVIGSKPRVFAGRAVPANYQRSCHAAVVGLPVVRVTGEVFSATDAAELMENSVTLLGSGPQDEPTEGTHDRRSVP
ncbi:MAG: uncharacterized protein KVP18_002380 [Porospora cf. gigantea A]|uniref:uncharacterized protein n=1 Tax=Porospora cf. gigantea A TaxID=2853593 RepID=UPI00355A05B5|nr:MAG: hypothetical protein KVP18_002380 [Porospora cf. gigantea A]